MARKKAERSGRRVQGGAGNTHGGQNFLLAGIQALEILGQHEDNREHEGRRVPWVQVQYRVHGPMYAGVFLFGHSLPALVILAGGSVLVPEGVVVLGPAGLGWQKHLQVPGPLDYVPRRGFMIYKLALLNGQRDDTGANHWS